MRSLISVFTPCIVIVSSIRGPFFTSDIEYQNKWKIFKRSRRKISFIFPLKVANT